jgi:succinyl-CoA synthetase alpha subunit
MPVFIGKDTRVLVQGITGREASKVVGEMKAYGTRVVAGVTPGKGGQEVEGVPVFDTVREAVSETKANASLVYVPPFAAKDAAIEAMASGIRFIDMVTERVPMHDTAEMLAVARETGTRIVGPTSVGVINPWDSVKLGPIGGSEPGKTFTKGPVGIVSKSGGMTNETAWLLTLNGIGQSTAMGIGGDFLMGTTFTDALEAFEKDKHTKAVVLFGELGGSYEEQAAEFVKSGGFSKPVVAFVAGKFADTLPGGVQLGHAGAIIEGSSGSPKAKIEAFRKAGVLVADIHDQIPELLKQVL